MNTKNLLVSFLLAIFLVAGVSAVDITSDAKVTIDGTTVYDVTPTGDIVAVVAGEDLTVKVYFTADYDDTDVTVEAELEGDKVKTYASTSVFDVEEDMVYRKVLSLKIPFELKDEVSNNLTLTIEIDGKEYKTELSDITLRVQRPSYNAVVKSVTTSSSVSAGEALPVEVVLKNLGYNDLEDVYVSVKIPELNVVQGPKWFGDMVSIEDHCTSCDDDETDTLVGRLSLNVPYGVKAGVYNLEVIVKNDDTESKVVKQVVINNELNENVIASNTAKVVAKGERAVYELLIVNPTNNVKVYKIVADSKEVIASADETVVAVPAGSSKTVKVYASSVVEGQYTFNVNVFNGENLEQTVAYNLAVEGKKTNTVLILTIVLAAIFLVLLVALIVLLGKKPEKSEEFGESYY